MISLVAAATILAVTPPAGGVALGEQAAYDQMLAMQARGADRMYAGAACDDSKVEVVSITPWKINDHPDLVVWREKVRVTGCGRTSIENVNVGRLGGSPPWKMVSGVPGESLADMNLQASVYPAAVKNARQGFAADCQVSLADAYVAARPGDADVELPGGQPRPSAKGHPSVTLPENIAPLAKDFDRSEAWMEVWPFKVCDTDRTLGVLFIPKKDGSSSLFLFLPIWQQVEAHGPGAVPAPVSPTH